MTSNRKKELQRLLRERIKAREEKQRELAEVDKGVDEIQAQLDAEDYQKLLDVFFKEFLKNGSLMAQIKKHHLLSDDLRILAGYLSREELIVHALNEERTALDKNKKRRERKKMSKQSKTLIDDVTVSSQPMLNETFASLPDGGFTLPPSGNIALSSPAAEAGMIRQY